MEQIRTKRPRASGDCVAADESRRLDEEPTMLTLTIKIPAQLDDGRVIPKGTVVEYLGHLVGGIVLVRWNDEKHEISPLCTQELS